jgi:hypothetical protein
LNDPATHFFHPFALNLTLGVTDFSLVFHCVFLVMLVSVTVTDRCILWLFIAAATVRVSAFGQELRGLVLHKS